MGLVNMARSQDEMRGAQPALEKSDEPKYPYGLRISLDNDSLKKLGVKELPAVGDTLMIKANVTVVSTSENESAEGGEYKCCDLQITDLGLGKQAREVGTDKIYSK